MFNQKAVLNHCIAFSDKYGIPRESVMILGGAALVLMGLRPEAKDIDLSVSREWLPRLMWSKDFIVQDCDHRPCSYWLTNEVFDITDTVYEQGAEYESFRIQAASNILALKRQSGREKDQADIPVLEKFVK